MRSLSAAVVILCLCIPIVSANMAMLVSLRRRLNILLTGNEINDDQYERIVNIVANDEILNAEMKDHDDHSIRPPLSQDKIIKFSQWLYQEVADKHLAVTTAEYISNIFNLSTPPGVAKDDSLSLIQNDAQALATYSNNGVVQFLARSNFSPPSSGQLYNGIWGYQTGNREYALQCNSVGLNILDVTTDNIVKLQTITMKGGAIWRDVATHSHYAYVAAQGGDGNAWVIDLSELSSSGPQSTDSSPISINKFKDIGNSNWGHTINVWNGLLFLNGACGSGNCGCKIFDLIDDPMNPKYLTTYRGGDCHDSYVQTIQNKNILITSDGYSRKWRLYDITNISNANFQFTLLGQTPTINSNIYAHQSIVSNDGKTLFAFDEFNKFDIAAFDISNLSSPQLIRNFQWSGEGQNGHPNTIVHNGFTSGKYLIVGYYEAGLRVFDISDVSNGVSEVGKYETYRDPDGNGDFDNAMNGSYQGAWNVYVGLPSGKILISDTKYGTFVVKIDDGDNPPTASPVASPVDSPTVLPVVSPVDPPTASPTKSPEVPPTKSPVISPQVNPQQNPTPVPQTNPTPAPQTNPTPPTSTECHTLCCFPIDDEGKGGWANSYMLGICDTQGCHYEISDRNGKPYCSGKNLYYDCVSSTCYSPTASPVKAPTDSPIGGPTDDCGSEKLFKVEIQNDSFSVLTYVVQKKHKRKNKWLKKKLMRGKVRKNKTDTNERCLSPDKCFQFKIVDKGQNDGLASGGYTLYWKGAIVKDSKFEVGAMETTEFGDKC